MRRALLMGVGVLALSGCAEHLELRAPPASAPAQERVAAYNELKGLSYHETTVTTIGTIGSGTTHSTDYMQLANGGRVYYPEDLLRSFPTTRHRQRRPTRAARNGTRLAC